MPTRNPPLTQDFVDTAFRYLTHRAKVVYGLIKAAGWRELEADDYELPLAELDGWGLIQFMPCKRRGYFKARARVIRARARR
jgi:hypothetical protein